MNDKLLLIAMVLAVAGCGKNDGAEGQSAVTGAEQTSEPSSGGVAETVEDAATESAEVIEGNVESIEADIEKSQDQSTVTPEQFKQSEKFPKEPVTEQAPPPAEAVEEQVEIIEDKPVEASGK